MHVSRFPYEEVYLLMSFFIKLFLEANFYLRHMFQVISKKSKANWTKNTDWKSVSYRESACTPWKFQNKEETISTRQFPNTREVLDDMKVTRLLQNVYKNFELNSIQFDILCSPMCF